MLRVFISHTADADTDQREKLASDLRAAEVDVWMAPGSIHPGEPFSGAIDRGLASSDYFVVLLSPASLASRWVQHEVNAALDRALRNEIEILPVLVSPVAVPPLLSTFQQIDLTRYEEGLAALGHAIGVPLRAGTEIVEGTTKSPTPSTGDRRRAPDAFVATVRADLERGAQHLGYLVLPAPHQPGSIVDLVVEVALLRVGVAVWPPASATIGQILAEVERELGTNPHRVAAMLAVCAGDSTTLTPHQLLDATSPNAMLLMWNEADGSDAVPASISLVTQHLTGAPPSSP
jgi:hypothetical protein